MNKKGLGIGLVLGIVIIAGALIWKGQDDEKFKQQLTEENRGQSEIAENISERNNYENEEYGFSIFFPGDLNKLSVIEEDLKYFNKSTDQKLLKFRYDLDRSTLRSESDPSLGRLSDMSVWYLKITPIDSWNDNMCEGIEDSCRQGKVLGENDEYVFESGFVNVEGAGYLCRENRDSQVEFCQVYDNFSAMLSGDSLQFRLMEDNDIDMSEWKTYVNQEYGFRLQYPNDWEARELYDPGYDITGFYFEEEKNIHFAVFPRGGFAQGITEPKLTIEKFKNKESRMLWHDNKSHPSFIYILSEYPSSWNKDNRIEVIGEGKYSEYLKNMYDNFEFIE
jgi:hypothetical protein